MSGTWPPLWGRAFPARQALPAGHSQRRLSSYKDATIVLANPCKAMPRRECHHMLTRDHAAQAPQTFTRRQPEELQTCLVSSSTGMAQ